MREARGDLCDGPSLAPMAAEGLPEPGTRWAVLYVVWVGGQVVPYGDLPGTPGKWALRVNVGHDS